MLLYCGIDGIFGDSATTPGMYWVFYVLVESAGFWLSLILLCAAGTIPGFAIRCVDGVTPTD